MSLFQRIRQHAAEQPEACALDDGCQKLNYRQLVSAVESTAEMLRSKSLRTLALQTDNSQAWIIIDLAAGVAGICLIPLPPFFSAEQRRHAIEKARVQAVITDQIEAFEVTRHVPSIKVQKQILYWIDIPESAARPDPIPPEVDKITFTSGTTGNPKGVMLSWQHMSPVVSSLVAATEMRPGDQHLTLLPLAVLLENLAGVYAPLWAGATVVVPSLAAVGLSGSSGLDSATMRTAMIMHRASTVIFTPQTLQALVELQEKQADPLPDLRFAAVGGAPVSPELLSRAATQGIPVHEGYGLSECSSVVSLNRATDSKPGSVGKALPHVRLEIGENHEVLIHSSGFAGYLGDPEQAEQPWPSGDLGYLDDDGFLFLTGRQRNVFITAFGRNVAPEWVERELTLEPVIAQAAVIGEARPWNLGVIVSSADKDSIEQAIQRTNRNLPDYARVHRWIRAEAPFTPQNKLLTGTGRIRRDALYQHYQTSISNEYDKHD